jgi:hypothetical protein
MTRALLLAVLCACTRTTTREPHEVNGQVFYTEQTQPSVGEAIVNDVVRGCGGSARDDDRVLSLVPTRPGCARRELVVTYVVDGVHRVEGCGESWRIRCRKSSTASPSGPVGCAVDCAVEDHFVETK